MLCLGALLLAAESPSQQQAQIDALEKRCQELYEQRKFSEALPLADKALELSKKAYGLEHSETADALGNLAELHKAMGNYAEAERFYKEALAAQEKRLGRESAELRPALTSLSRLYWLLGQYDKAALLAERTLTIAEKEKGAGHLETATALNDLALVYDSRGDYAKAEALYQRALAIREKKLSPDDALIAAALNNLAGVYTTMGHFAKAEPLYQRALTIDEKAFGLDSPKIATLLNNFALFYSEIGDYTKAEATFQRALKAFENGVGPEGEETATVLSNLGGVYRNTGEYAKAQLSYERALSILEKALGPDHPKTATALNNLALFHAGRGDPARAEALYQRALKIEEKAMGPENPQVAATLNNLALLYDTIGDYAKAESLYQRSLRIREKALGLEHPDVAVSLANLGWVYAATKDYVKAAWHYTRALQIDEKAFGVDHPNTATELDQLARIYKQVGAYRQAEPLMQRVLRIREKAFGPNHPDIAQALSSLAGLYDALGDYTKAEPLYHRALEIRTKALGPDHPDTADSLNDLAFLEIKLGRMKEAGVLAAQERQAKEKYLANILSFTSEQQRLRFQETKQPYSVLATLGDADGVAEAVLRRKGVVLDSLLEDRSLAEASNDPKLREIIDQLRSSKQRLTHLVFRVSKSLSRANQEEELRQEREKLSTEVEQLEARLARDSGLGKARRALSITVSQVQTALPSHTVLVEFLKCRHYIGKQDFEAQYDAVVIPAAGRPRWVPLGNAVDLEKKLALYRKSARGETDETTLNSTLHGLHSQLWGPIEKALPPETTSIIISPDAELSFLSFATLLGTDDRLLCEKYSVRYVASGRDLLRDAKAHAQDRSLAVFANPDFALTNNARRPNDARSVALPSGELRGFQSLSLSPLPGTARESSLLEVCAKKSGWQMRTNLGGNATEAELRRTKSPRILHLATHGFFLRQSKPESVAIERGGAEINGPTADLINPMHRSGIALAGGETTLEAWAKGEVPPIENDGIVTADEVGGLKLDGTWLVVLSACDTATGEAKAGEGVMGLRRGFIQAGAQNLLMTLWPISDETTVNIMLDFYAAAFKTGNAPQALADVQRDWLVKLRKEKGLLAAVRLAGPFIMSSQGKP